MRTLEIKSFILDIKLRFPLVMLYTILVLETLYLSDEKKLYFFLSELVTGRRLESSFT